MIINWYKYIQMMLPVRLQVVKIIDFIRAYMWQMPKVNSDINLRLLDLKYKANIIASVMAIEHLIGSELDVSATITELSGNPYDFQVNISSYVDEIRLTTLIEQYKPAGKTFTYRLGAVAFSAEWSAYECEDIVEIYTAEWSDYECEENGELELRVSSNVMSDNFHIYVSASKIVTSDLSIYVRVYEMIDGEQIDINANIRVTILTGDQTGQNNTSGIDSSGRQLYTEISTITPLSDDYYTYIKG